MAEDMTDNNIKKQLEDVNELRQFCERQMLKLKQQITHFIGASKRVSDYFGESVGIDGKGDDDSLKDGGAMLARYVSCLNTALDYAMHMNLALVEYDPLPHKCLCNDASVKATVTSNEIFRRYNPRQEQQKMQPCEGSLADDDTTSDTTSITPKVEKSKDKYKKNEINGNYSSTIDGEDDGDDIDDDGYPMTNIADLSEYNVGATILGAITHVSEDDIYFFIRTENAQKVADIVELMQSTKQPNWKQNMRSYNFAIPPPIGEVFAFALDHEESLVRAVRTSELYRNTTGKDILFDAYLLDYGDNVPLHFRTICYYVNTRIKLKPALAVRCKLADKQKMSIIKSNVLKQIKFRVVKKCHSHLLVDVVNSESGKEEKNSTNPFLRGSQSLEEPDTTESESEALPKGLKLSSEDWQMLNEETLCTTNPMKAVLGFVPKDEQRICRFYNPKTGGCFKGNNCRKEHTMLNPEGYTKDLDMTAPLIHCSTMMSSTAYEKHTRLTVIPTHIKDLTHYYAQILEVDSRKPKDAAHEPFVWCYEDLPAAKELTRPPHILELVLAKYVDDIYYRAQVLEEVNDYEFTVFFVDYGNKITVPISSMAVCDDISAFPAFQAVLLCIAGVTEIDNIDKQQEAEGKQLISSAILNKKIVVKVIAQYQEDILVKFVERELKSLPALLVERGFANPYED